MTTSLIDGLGESVADQSKMIYDYFSTSFEHFAGDWRSLEGVYGEFQWKGSEKQRWLREFLCMGGWAMRNGFGVKNLRYAGETVQGLFGDGSSHLHLLNGHVFVQNWGEKRLAWQQRVSRTC